MLRSYRILAIDPCCKGFGFVIFQVGAELLEHGLVRIEKNKETATIIRFEEFLLCVRPDELILEHAHVPGSRRRPRIVKLLENMRKVAHRHQVAVYEIPRLEICAHFGTTKYKIALQLAQDYPALAHKLPLPRKLWQSEDDRLAIFDAQALVSTCLGFLGQPAARGHTPEDYMKSQLTPLERLVY